MVLLSNGLEALTGIPRVHLALRSAPPTGTFIGYLYDVGALGTGRPTWTSATAGLDAAFPATAYDMPAGDRLALALDTQDPLYLDANGFGTPLTISGPSWLDVPTN